MINKYFGLYGILLFVLVVLTIITYFYYKLCMLVSNKNKMLSTIITVVTMSLLASTFITTRPQIFTYLNLILVLYVMELYSKTNNKKYLLFLPLISLMQINIYGMFFLMLFIFMLPYVVNAFKFNFKDNNQKNMDYISNDIYVFNRTNKPIWNKKYIICFYFIRTKNFKRKNN